MARREVRPLKGTATYDQGRRSVGCHRPYGVARFWLCNHPTICGPPTPGMLVIVSVSRLANDKFEIRVARPQHDSNRMQEYSSVAEARTVLSAFGHQRRVDRRSFDIACPDGYTRAAEFPPDGCPTTRIALTRIPLVNLQEHLLRKCLSRVVVPFDNVETLYDGLPHNAEADVISLRL